MVVFPPFKAVDASLAMLVSQLVGITYVFLNIA
jgi:hypothetical protein